jgi:hypothetical protein
VDSFQAPWPGHFYVTTRNPIGQSCASNLVYVATDVITSVPGQVTTTRGRPRIFDVQGRLVTGPLASGVYWRRVIDPDGTETVRRIVVLR